MTSDIQQLPKNLLITETDILLQPAPADQLLNFSRTQSQAVLAQTSRLFWPNCLYNSVDSVGHIGKYQFNASELEKLGYIRQGTLNKLANTAGANAVAINNESYWSGLDQCNNASQWRTNPGLQEQAIMRIFQIMAAQLTTLVVNFGSLAGSQQAGLLTVAHVLGSDGAAALYGYLMGTASSGDPKDSRGYHYSAYFYAAQRAYDLGTLVSEA